MIITNQALFDSLTDAEKDANYFSHRFGNVDDCIRCIYCEIGQWNGWKERCPA